MFTVYAYANCSTCRSALHWLQQRGIPHRVVPIRESPPSTDELRAALDAVGGELRPLFNTAGTDYRAMGLKDELPTMEIERALQLLSSNGNLVKRPFLVGDGVALNGFQEARWTEALSPSA